VATRADVRSDVSGLLGADANLSSAEINTLIQLRLDHLYETVRWSRRVKEFSLTTVAQTSSTSATTVTVTNGSATVTSAGTPFTSAMVGYRIAISSGQPYWIDTFVSSAEITLGDGEGTAVTYQGDDDTAASWRVFKTLYSLPADADEVLSLASLLGQVEELDGGRDALDRLDFDRSTTQDLPTRWVYAGIDSSGYRRIELWPVATTADVLTGQYARTTPTLSDSSVIPFNRALLVYGVAADCFNVLAEKTGDENFRALALFYERKHNEVKADVLPIEYERMGLPTSLGRVPSGRGRLRNTDYSVDHQIEEP